MKFLNYLKQTSIGLLQSQGGVPPIIFGLKDGDITAIPFSFSNDSEKENIMVMAKAAFTVIGIEEYYIVQESWYLDQSDEISDIPVRDHLNRKEAITILHVSKGGADIIQIPFLRDGEAINLSEESVIQGVEGNLTKLLPTEGSEVPKHLLPKVLEFIGLTKGKNDDLM